jgi:hypothetical protein
MIDFSDHRVIAITIGLCIAITSLIIIFIKYLVGHHRRKKVSVIEENNDRTE